jgi:hypothetical protein
VRAVAIAAGRDLVMLRVTGVAGHIGVSAADGVRPLCRRGMTACTGCANVLKGGEIKVERGVGWMAAAAVGQGVMLRCIRGMAVGAGCSRVLSSRVGVG